MASSLVTLWRSNAVFFAQKSCAQVVRLAGDGRLRDGNDASNEFRELLGVLPAERLRSYAEECLSEKFDDAAFALQDIVNEIGSRLGFTTEPGRYRGVRNQVGFDGLWRSLDTHTLLIEVKTTDAYRINLDTIADYRTELVKAGRIHAGASSILIAVGREDTGDLEAQIRGSRHAWDIRVISIEALLRLMAVKEQMSDWDTSARINMILRPLEYTRVDGFVDLLFATTKDIESSQENPDVDDSPQPSAADVGHPAVRFDHDLARTRALALVETHLGHNLKKKGSVYWSTADGRTNVVCLSSQPYGDEGPSRHFWYGVKPGQKVFLEETDRACIVFACGLNLPPVLIEAAEFLLLLAQLKTTPPQPTPDAPLVHWHVTIYRDGQAAALSTPLSGGRTDITQFILK